ncbi:hypothetical protein, partial [Mycobacterium avium]
DHRPIAGPGAGGAGGWAGAHRSAVTVAALPRRVAGWGCVRRVGAECPVAQWVCRIWVRWSAVGSASDRARRRVMRPRWVVPAAVRPWDR